MENRSHTRSIIEEDVVWAAAIDPNTVVDAEGNRLIHLAAYHGFSNAVSALIEHGADLNAINKYGEVASVIALRNGHASLAFALRAQERVAKAKFGNALDLEQGASETDSGRSISVLRDADAPSSRSIGSHNTLAPPAESRSPVGHFAPTSETALMASDPDWQPPAIDALGSPLTEADLNLSNSGVGDNSAIDDEYENVSGEQDVALGEEEVEEQGAADGGYQGKTESSLDWLMANYATEGLIRTFSLRVNNSMQNIEALTDQVRSHLVDYWKLLNELSDGDLGIDEFSLATSITDDIDEIIKITIWDKEGEIDAGRIADGWHLEDKFDAMEALEKIHGIAKRIKISRLQEQDELLNFIKEKQESIGNDIYSKSREIACCLLAISQIADYLCVDDLDKRVEEAIDYVMFEPNNILIDPITHGYDSLSSKLNDSFAFDDDVDEEIDELKAQLDWDSDLWSTTSAEDDESM
jgi:hypothetical protein